MIAGSVSELTFIRTVAGWPEPAASATARMWSIRPRAQVERRHEQLPELLRPAEPGHVVEEVGDVGGDRLVVGEEAEILVQRARSRPL